MAPLVNSETLDCRRTVPFPQQHATRKSDKYGFSWLYQEVGRKARLPICCRSLPLSHAWFAN